MGNVAISVQDLWKQYRIGLKKSTSFREQMGMWFQNSREEERYFWALKEIDFEINYGDAVGIIGRNGAGKSTLLKILSKITYPTRGRIEINGRVSSLLEVGTGFHPELTGRQNIFLNGTILGMTRKEIQAKFDEIVSFSGVEKFIETPVKHYSSGMKVRLAFSVAAHLEPEILIIDEVLAVGDAEFQKKCLGKMEDVTGEGRTVLFVSHNMPVVKSLCSKGILLIGGEKEIEGTSEKVVNHYLSIENTIEQSGYVKDLSQISRESNLSQTIKFSKCALLNSENEPSNHVNFGEPLSFYIELESNLLNMELDIVIGINSVIGDRLASGSRILKLESEKMGIVCKMNHITLTPGVYTLYLGIRKQDQLMDAFRFEVSKNTFTGVRPYQGNKGNFQIDFDIAYTSEFNAR